MKKLVLIVLSCVLFVCMSAPHHASRASALRTVPIATVVQAPALSASVALPEPTGSIVVASPAAKVVTTVHAVKAHRVLVCDPVSYHIGGTSQLCR